MRIAFPIFALRRNAFQTQMNLEQSLNSNEAQLTSTKQREYHDLKLRHLNVT